MTGTESTAGGVLHMHGLGTNPKDGLLDAATHAGLFRLTAEGAAEQVGKKDGGATWQLRYRDGRQVSA